MAEPRRCPACGAELPAQAPEGLCPKCLLGVGLEASMPAPVPAGELAAPAGASQHHTGTMAASSLAEGPGTRIGPYKLLQLIGEGGMGTVWMAGQREPVRRMVALKVIKAGMDSGQVVARFEAERDREAAKFAEANAKREADRADASAKLARRHLYVTHINLAQTAWENAGLVRVLEWLKQHETQPGEEDLRGFEWHYWNRLAHPYQLNLKGHTRGVTSVAFSADGKRLA